MKKEITFLQKFLDIKRVLSAYEWVFDQKPAACQAKTQFFLQTDELADQINLLLRPAQTITIARRDQRAWMKTKLTELANLGLIMASRKKDDEMKEIFRYHNKKIRAVSSAMVIELGRDMLQIFNQNDALSNELGFSADQRTETAQQLEEFHDLLFSTQSRLDDRRENQYDINQLIKAINALLSGELDCFARFCRSNHPSFYTAYMRLRRKSHHKSATSASNDTASEETITEESTHAPLSGTLIELGLNTTPVEQGNQIFKAKTTESTTLNELSTKKMEYN